jgi:hypothetical protein
MNAMLPVPPLAAARHGPPLLPVVLRQQNTVLLRTLRAPQLVLGLLALLLLLDLQGTLPGRAGSPALLLLFYWLWLPALAWSSALWAGEPPAKRHYHSALPVDRAVHDLSRVLVGAAWLVGAVAIAIVCGGALAAWRGDAAALEPLTAWAWLNYFTYPLLLYTLGSADAVSRNRAFSGLLVGFALLLVLLIVVAEYELELVRRALHALLSGPVGLVTGLVGGFSWALSEPDAARALNGPVQRGPLVVPPAQWLFAMLLWGGLFALLLVRSARRRLLG